MQAIEETAQANDVYNLLVERSHTYRVGNKALLVHNGECVGTLSRALPEKIEDVAERRLNFRDEFPTSTLKAGRDYPEDARMNVKLSAAESFGLRGWIERSSALRHAASATPLDHLTGWRPLALAGFNQARYHLFAQALAKLPVVPGKFFRGMSGVSPKVVEGYLKAATTARSFD